MFRSLAQHLQARSSLQRLRTTVLLPNGTDRSALAQCFVGACRAAGEEAGVIPSLLTLNEFWGALAGEASCHAFSLSLLFTLAKRLQAAFSDLSLFQAATQAQTLLRLRSFCVRLGGSLAEPPFPLFLLSERDRRLIALLEEVAPSPPPLTERLAAFLQARPDETFIAVDALPSVSTPALETLRRLFKGNGQEVWTPPKASPQAVSMATFMSLDEEAAGIVQALPALQGPVAIVTDYAPLRQKIMAELIAHGLAFRKPGAPTLADSSWGEALLAVQAWLEDSSAVSWQRLGASLALRATPSQATLFAAFTQRVLRAPSLIIEGDLLVPSQANEAGLRLILNQQDGKDSLLAEWFEALCRLRQTYVSETEATWGVRVERLQAAWEALVALWGEPGAYPSLRAFFALVRQGPWEMLLTAEDFAGLLRLLMPSVPAPEQLAFGEATKPEVLLLSSAQAVSSAYESVIFAGMDDQEGVAEAPFPPLLLKPDGWDRALQEALFRQACSGKTVIATRTAHPEARPHPLLALLEEAQAQGVPEALPAGELIVEGASGAATMGSVEEVVARAFVPLEARPRRLAVSDLQRLQDDPYAFFARKILRLYPSSSPSLAVDYGRWAHDVLHRYFATGAWARGERLTAFLEADTAHNPIVIKRFRPRLRPVLAALEEELLQARERLEAVWTEHRLEVPFSVAGEVLRLYGIADRIDWQRAEEGIQAVTLIDYKTGTLPTESALRKLEALQLPVEAFLLRRLHPKVEESLRVVQLKYEALRMAEVSLPFGEALEADVQSKLEALLASYLCEDYVFETPAQAPKACEEYRHLKRLP